jgi:F0F1-type ATP synthase membrane subunit b/b'
MEQPMSTDPTTPPPANSLEAVHAAIANYRQQGEMASQQLQQLEANYTSQHTQLATTIERLVGAIAAMDQLAKNITDEAKIIADRIAVSAKPERVPLTKAEAIAENEGMRAVPEEF